MAEIVVGVDSVAASVLVQADITNQATASVSTVMVEIPGAADMALTIAAAQGPSGPPGGGSGSPDLSLFAGQVLSGHRAVTLDASGRAIYASANVPLHATRVLGITTQAADLGAAVAVATQREVIEPSWSWDTTKPVFLAANGLLTQTQPSTPGSAFSLTVGFPTSPTGLFVSVGFPINIV